MAITTASDSIGLDYRINLAQLSATIKKAKAQVDGLNRSLVAMSKKSSATIAAFNAKMMSSKEKFTAKSNAKMLKEHNQNIAAREKSNKTANKQFNKGYDDRVKSSKQATTKMLADSKKATASRAKAMTDFKETYTKAMYPSKELKKMGVTAGTTTAHSIR